MELKHCIKVHTLHFIYMYFGFGSNDLHMYVDEQWVLYILLYTLMKQHALEHGTLDHSMALQGYQNGHVHQDLPRLSVCVILYAQFPWICHCEIYIDPRWRCICNIHSLRQWQHEEALEWQQVSSGVSIWHISVIVVYCAYNFVVRFSVNYTVTVKAESMVNEFVVKNSNGNCDMYRATFRAGLKCHHVIRNSCDRTIRSCNKKTSSLMLDFQTLLHLTSLASFTLTSEFQTSWRPQCPVWVDWSMWTRYIVRVTKGSRKDPAWRRFLL